MVLYNYASVYVFLSGFTSVRRYTFPLQIQICAGLMHPVNFSCTRTGVNSYMNRLDTFITQSIDRARYLGLTHVALYKDSKRKINNSKECECHDSSGMLNFQLFITRVPIMTTRGIINDLWDKLLKRRSERLYRDERKML